MIANQAANVKRFSGSGQPVIDREQHHPGHRTHHQAGTNAGINDGGILVHGCSVSLTVLEAAVYVAHKGSRSIVSLHGDYR